MILFLTDGDPGEGKTTILDSIDRLNAELGNAVSIYTFGIGKYSTVKTGHKLSIAKE